jgi:hypothetical protein
MTTPNFDVKDPNINLVRLEDGSLMSQRVVDLIEVIKQTWPFLDVRWVPERKLGPGEPKFLIVETTADGQEYPVFWVKDEDEFTGEILERLYLSDNSKGDVLTRMDARNAALEALRKKVAQDKMDEARDIMLSAIRSPLNWYKLPNGKVIKDYGNKVQ